MSKTENNLIRVQEWIIRFDGKIKHSENNMIDAQKTVQEISKKQATQ